MVPEVTPVLLVLDGGLGVSLVAMIDAVDVFSKYEFACCCSLLLFCENERINMREESVSYCGRFWNQDHVYFLHENIAEQVFRDITDSYM